MQPTRIDARKMTKVQEADDIFAGEASASKPLRSNQKKRQDPKYSEI